MVVNTENWPRYLPPISPVQFPTVSGACLIFGLVLTAYFFVYEVTSDKPKQPLKEILLSGSASIFCAIGILFLLLSVGIYV